MAKRHVTVRSAGQGYALLGICFGKDSCRKDADRLKRTVFEVSFCCTAISVCVTGVSRTICLLLFLLQKQPL